MDNREYLRAIYDAKRNSYVSAEAFWRDGKPDLEYCFTLYVDEPAGNGTFNAGLEKLWIDDEGDLSGEYFVFGAYKEAAFADEIKQIREQAQKIALRDNLDEFMAVIDVVKQRAVDNDLEDDFIFDLEGLFDNGPEDAYTLRDIGDSPRLHHHIERDDEYWYMLIAPVIDMENLPLGWGLFAVHLPDLNSESTKNEAANADRVRVLLLDHLHTEQEAKLAKRGLEHFMEVDRMDNPDFAQMNDTEVLAGATVDAEWDEETGDVVWKEYNRKTFQDFVSGSTPYQHPREKWKPRDKPLVDLFFEENPQPTWLEDQLRAAFDEDAGVKPETDENSPWANVDLE